MANRSYLFSSDSVTHTGIRRDCKPIGIAEWGYDIPLVFKILLSGNPATCRSLLFAHTHDIALVGDFAQGVRNFERFLKRIDVPAARPMIEEARRFLNKPENQRRYFLLECGEIFCMDEKPHHEQNSALLQEIQALAPRIDDAIRSVKPPRTGLFAKLLQRKRPVSSSDSDLTEAVRVLGFGNWSNHLYFGFADA